MEWTTVLVWSVSIVSIAVVLVYIIKAAEKVYYQKSISEQNIILEILKQINTQRLIEESRKNEPTETISQSVDELKKLVNGLGKKIKTADETTKQALDKANAQIEIYEKYLNKKA